MVKPVHNTDFNASSPGWTLILSAVILFLVIVTMSERKLIRDPASVKAVSNERQLENYFENDFNSNPY